jgi:DNA-binding NarL/FixJ family response regulator
MNKTIMVSIVEDNRETREMLATRVNHAHSLHCLNTYANAEQALTRREEEVLALLAKGLLYKEICESLNICLPTVRTHVSHIYEKLHVRSRTEATLKYLKRD